MMITKMFSPTETSQAAEEIKLGELVAFPTETVYGLGADATNEQAVKRVYLAKGRPSDNPLIVTVSSPEMAAEYIADYGEYGHELIKTFWPGPLTIVFKIKPDSLSPVVTGGLTTAAFRMPENETTRKMIAEAGVPIVGPSANSSGKPSPTTAQHVFHDMEGKIAGILDDGPTKVGVESTIIDLSASKPAVLRPGGITPQQIEAVIGCSVDASQHKVGAKETPKAPGMKYKHYAPSAQVIIVDDKSDFKQAIAQYQAKNVPMGVMAVDEILQEVPAGIKTFSLGNDVISASRDLFAGLRQLDADHVKFILAQGFPDADHGEAYSNRLNKSAGNTHYKN